MYPPARGRSLPTNRRIEGLTFGYDGIAAFAVFAVVELRGRVLNGIVVYRAVNVIERYANFFPGKVNSLHVCPPTAELK